MLIQWEGLSVEDVTWKLLKDVLLAYPHHHLEDKVFVDGGRIDTNQNINQHNIISDKQEHSVTLDKRNSKTTEDSILEQLKLRHHKELAGHDNQDS